MGKKALAIIGASYLQLPLILKAKEMGYETHVFAWAADDVGEKEADYFYPLSIVDKEDILEQCRKIGIIGVCTIASDLAVVTVNYIANRMGLIGNSEYCTEITTNKYSMRDVFAKNNVPSPKYMLIDEGQKVKNITFSYPVIVKPVDRSGSRGIFKIESGENLEDAIDIARNVSFSKKCLIEEYVEGKEYSVECISYKGKHQFLALTEKHTTGSPHFIETGHEQPAMVSEEILAQVKKEVFHALDSLQIENGASHSEIKIDSNNTIKFIEIGARMGGDCIGSDLVKLSTGYDFIEMVIKVAVGEKPEMVEKDKVGNVAIKYIMDEDDLKEFYRIRDEFPEKIIKSEMLDLESLGKSTDSSNRAGYYIIKQSK